MSIISKPLLTNETMKTALLTWAISYETVVIPTDLTTLMMINRNTKLITERMTPSADLMIASSVLKRDKMVQY